MEYISSKYTHSQVLDILNKEKDRATTRWSNPRYASLQIYAILINVSTVTAILYILWQFIYKHISYLFPWMRIGKHVIDNLGISITTGMAVGYMVYIYLWFAVILLLRKVLFVPANIAYRSFVKNGAIIIDKYGRKRIEIMAIYRDIERFINFVDANPELSERDFEMDDTGRYLVHKIHQLDGDKNIKFYFGLYLKDIIKEHNTLDFSKMDEYYNL